MNHNGMGSVSRISFTSHYDHEAAVRRIVQLHQFSPYHLISWIWVPPPSLRESSVPSSEDIYNVNQYSFIICVTPYSFLHPVPLRSSMTHSVSPSERNRAYRITSKPFNHQQWSHGTEGAARGRWDHGGGLEGGGVPPFPSHLASYSRLNHNGN